MALKKTLTRLAEKRILEQQHWTIANTLCGNIDAGDFIDHIIDIIFYKNLSRTTEAYANVDSKH